MGTRQFFFPGDIHLADLHKRSRIFHDNQVVVSHHRAAGDSDLSVFTQCEGCVCRSRITRGCCFFTQGICRAGFQTSHFVSCIAGIPLGDNLILSIQNLDMGTRQFFFPGDCPLAYADCMVAILDRQFLRGTKTEDYAVCLFFCLAVGNFLRVKYTAL